MNTDSVIAELVRLGASVTVVDGNLALVYPEGVMTPDLVEAIRKNKPALLAYFWLGPKPQYCDACRSTDLSTRSAGRAWVCDRCHPRWEGRAA
jgi:hypothetical protein